jgi:uncharacterized protein YbjQ (UPF0145 family)
MTIWWLAFILVSLLVVIVGFSWIVLEIKKLAGPGKVKKSVEDLDKAYSNIAEDSVDHLFNTEFREELRNRGRLRFEKIIDENAMFLKQDLDVTISQLNEYMKKQISTNLDQEFAAYAKAMSDAQQLALATLQRTAADVEAQRVKLAEALESSVAARETALVKIYEDNMAVVVEHYVLQALGDQFDMKTQLPFIIKQMESNKQAIIEDMRA